jgi:hypothetical protein
LVEAAGVEPSPSQNVNLLMARGFSSQLPGNSLPCGQFVVLSSALACSGVLPSFGDGLETVGYPIRRLPSKWRPDLSPRALPCQDI